MPSLDPYAASQISVTLAKIEAYETRGAMAPYESKDLEDLVALLDGAAGLESDVAAENHEVRTYVAEWATRFVNDARVRDLIEGHLPRGPLFEERTGRVLQRLKQLEIRGRACPPIDCVPNEI